MRLEKRKKFGNLISYFRLLFLKTSKIKKQNRMVLFFQS